MTTKITVEQLREYLDLEAERKALESKARAIGRKTDALEKHFRTYLDEAGKECVVRHNHRIYLEEGRPRVSWKDAYVELAGPIAAHAVLDKADKPLKLRVAKAA